MGSSSGQDMKGHKVTDNVNDRLHEAKNAQVD